MFKILITTIRPYGDGTSPSVVAVSFDKVSDAEFAIESINNKSRIQIEGNSISRFAEPLNFEVTQ